LDHPKRWSVDAAGPIRWTRTGKTRNRPGPDPSRTRTRRKKNPTDKRRDVISGSRGAHATPAPGSTTEPIGSTHQNSRCRCSALDRPTRPTAHGTPASQVHSNPPPLLGRQPPQAAWRTRHTHLTPAASARAQICNQPRRAPQCPKQKPAQCNGCSACAAPTRMFPPGCAPKKEGRGVHATPPR
jgi:hypothetical protein